MVGDDDDARPEADRGGGGGAPAQRQERVVEVRVNDRGPVIPGRILDLSYAAARKLGAVGAGVIPVSIVVLPER